MSGLILSFLKNTGTSSGHKSGVGVYSALVRKCDNN